MDCLENLEKCKASCCRWVVFGHPTMDKTSLNYLEQHGCKVIQERANLFKIWVPSKCKQLTDDNKCKIYGDDARPFACKDLEEETKGKYNITEGCIIVPDTIKPVVMPIGGISQEVVDVKAEDMKKKDI